VQLAAALEINQKEQDAGFAPATLICVPATASGFVLQAANFAE
jgi:hypothetical protein